MYKQLAEYETIFDKHLNKSLIEKSDDRPLLDFIIEAWYSLQIIDGIEINISVVKNSNAIIKTK